MAKMIFSDDGLKKQLEAIMHPEIQRLFKQELNKVPPKSKLVSYQIPLLFEKNMDLKKFYKIISVCAPREICIQRAMTRSKYNYELASKIFDEQYPQKLKLSKSDFCVVNHGSRNRLEKLAQEIIDTI